MEAVNHEYVEALFQGANDAIITSDLNGRVVLWNPGAEQLFQFGADEMVGQPLDHLIPIDRQHEDAQVRIRLLKGEPAVVFDTVRLAKDGRRIEVSLTQSPIRIGNRIVGISNITRPIRDPQKLDDLLEISLAEIKNLKSALDEHAIVAITDPKGKISYVNDKFCQISKYSRDELIGQDHRIINSGHHPQNFFKELWDTISAGRVFKGEICNRAKDGTEYWVDTTIVPFLDNDGQPFQYVAIRADITERKKVEQQILELNSDLKRHANELEVANKEMDSFCYSVSHDLRAPLRSIASFSAILSSDYAERLDETGNDYLQRITSASERMGQLIDDLLKLSRVSREEMSVQRVNMSTMAESIVEELRAVDPDRKIEFKIEENLIVHGAPRLLRATLDNLLSNAWKFTSKEPLGIVEFGSEPPKEGTRSTVFFVRDNGAGFDMQYADRLFGPFQRLHSYEEFAGIGIGLATVQRIIHRHGGNISADAELGEGATFRFTLPGA